MSNPKEKQFYDIIENAFLKSHNGSSTDDTVIDDGLNADFIKICKSILPFVDEFDLNWALMNMRKQGKLGSVTTKRKRCDHTDYIHASEIAARLMYDRHNLSIDRVLCHSVHRKEFDSIANSIAPEIPTYLLRKAALTLRKTRRLRPELVIRIASWNKEVLELPAGRVVDAPNLVPKQPGIYILRDNTGYLYIGESMNLRGRIAKHLDHSDRKSLAYYLWKNGVNDITIEIHAFDPESEGRFTQNRRAYESDLILSRKPKFNIQP